MGDHLGRSIHTVNIAQMRGNVPCRHAFGIHGQDLIFDVGDIRLVFLYDLRFKLAFAIAWDIQIDRAHR